VPGRFGRREPAASVATRRVHWPGGRRWPASGCSAAPQGPACWPGRDIAGRRFLALPAVVALVALLPIVSSVRALLTGNQPEPGRGELPGRSWAGSGSAVFRRRL